MGEPLHIKVKPGQSPSSPTFLPARPNLAGPGRDFAEEAQRSIPLVSQPALAPAERTTSCPFSPRGCPFGGACHACPVGLQAKLKIGAPDDEYEREADQVADTVLRMPDPAVQRSCPLCDDDERLQAKAVTGQPQAVSRAAQAQIESLRGGGRPLDPATRAFFEPRFGYDFSGVRVHTDTNAAEAARTVNALAYTIGRDVVFGAGEYAPETTSGRRLLAHELTHVVQQAGGAEVVQRRVVCDEFGENCQSIPDEEPEVDGEGQPTALIYGENGRESGEGQPTVPGTPAEESSQPEDLYWGQSAPEMPAEESSQPENLGGGQPVPGTPAEDVGPGPQPTVLHVEFCSRVADLPLNKQTFGIRHWWLRTPKAEAGMGPANGGVPGHGGSDYPGVPTMITEHAGEGNLPESTCIPVEEHSGFPVKMECVESHLRVGTETGRWWPWNQCHTVVDNILEDCRDWSTEPAEFTNPDPYYRYTGERKREREEDQGSYE